MGLTGNDIMKPIRRFNQHKLILDENTNAQFLLLLIKNLSINFSAGLLGLTY